MPNQSTIGIDLGGTNIRGGKICENILSDVLSSKVSAQGSVADVLREIFALTDALIDGSVAGIGIGVPGLVDKAQGIVFDVVKIPAWKEVPLRKLMEERYGIPVFIDNDANCFALGEFYFGKGRGCSSMIGLTIGTGLGSGIILQNKLYAGSNGGAGEFGMIDYLDHCYEYYASGQFFQNKYGIDGELVFRMAKEGSAEYLEMYAAMGTHLGNAIKAILYALDVELIVLGGSVRHAWPYFQKTMWQQVQTFAYRKAKEQLRIEVSALENSGLLGAASLYYDERNKGLPL